MATIDIGIKDQDRKAIADGLSRLLADTYTLYLKTHNFHWNVTGPMFQTLHLMFETQYNELALAVDSDRGADSRARLSGAGHLRRLREAFLDQGNARRAEGRGDDPAAGRRPGSGRAHRALGLSRSSKGARRSRPPTC